MNLKNKVTNKELSKKIWDLGWRLRTEFYWVDVFENLEGNEECWQIHHIGWFNDQKESYHPIPAPLACEIMKILPSDFSVHNTNQGFEVCEYKQELLPYKELLYTCKCFTVADTEANAIAKTLIYLTERGRIKP